MKNFALTTLLTLLLSGGAESAAAVEKNKCGCYRDDAGVCFCDKGSKCGCPGDCEPKGCDKAREKQIEKEIDAETKKAVQDDRSHEDSSGNSSGKAKGSSREKSSLSDKRSVDDSGSPSTARRLTAAQAKRLVKLLDLYLDEKPDARRHSVDEVRNELSHSR